jgi:hypothetical protein
MFAPRPRLSNLRVVAGRRQQRQQRQSPTGTAAEGDWSSKAGGNGADCVILKIMNITE